MAYSIVCLGGLLAGSVAISPAAFAATGSGSLDSTFGNNGIAEVNFPGQLNRITYDQASGELVAAGDYNNSPQEIAVTRYTSAGQPDSSFGSNGNGIATDPLGSGGSGSSAEALAVDQSTGNVYAAGYESSSVGTSSPALVSFTSSGQLDSTFNSSSGVTALESESGSFTAVAVDSVTKEVIVAGSIVANGSTDGELVVEAFPLSGSTSGPWTYMTRLSSSKAGGDSAAGLAIDPATGDVYVDGTTPCSSSNTEAFFLELSTTGSPVSSFNGGAALKISANGCSVPLSATDLAYTTTGANSSSGQLVASGTLASSTPEAVLFSLSSTGAFSDNGFSSPGYVADPALSSGSAIAFEPTSSTNPNPDGIIETGTAAGSSSPGEVGVTSFSMTGTTQTSFGANGTATSSALTCPDSGTCGSGVVVEPSGDIGVSGVQGTTTTKDDLAVAELLNQALDLSGPGTVSLTQSASATFTVQLVGANTAALTSAPVKVDYATSGGTAQAGVNYTSVSGTISFPCGSEPSGVSCSGETATITVPLITPAGASGTLSFNLVLSNPTNAGISTSSVTADIAYGSAASNSGGSGSTSSGTSSSPPPPPPPPAKPTKIVPGEGYWIAEANGTVLSYGDAEHLGSLSPKQLRGHGQITGIAAAAGGKGYWLVSSLGTVYGFGDAKYYGSVLRKHLRGIIKEIVPAPAYNGYLLVSSTGMVYRFGRARAHGSLARPRLRGTIVGLAQSAGVGGYWMASTAGSVYAFGQAKSHGWLKKGQMLGPVAAIISSARRTGYWVISAKGRVDAFGTAKRRGEPKPKKVDGVIRGAVATPNGLGYWMVTSKGSVYNFGGAKFYGSAVRNARSQPVGLAAT